MTFGNFEISPRKDDLKDNTINLKESLPDNTEINDSTNKVEQFERVPLTDQEKELSVIELAQKYNLPYFTARLLKNRGYRAVKNDNFESKVDKFNKEINFLKEITPLSVDSVETIWGNEKEQELIRQALSSYSRYKYWQDENKKYVDSKRFKLLNGTELSFGDLSLIDKMIDLKPLRDNKSGNLMVFDKKTNGYRKFKHTDFVKSGYTFSLKDINKKDNISLEDFAPYVYQTGIFNEQDFSKHRFGDRSYTAHGAHERILSRNGLVFMSNENGSSKYYLGKKKFVGTNEKINYDNIGVVLLDNNTAGVIDNSNGKENILYTFPLIDKETYSNKKDEIINKRKDENKSMDVNLNDYILTTPTLNKYLTTDYFKKNEKESDIDYANRISKLSDISYVLGNFRSFMSETGLAANNYSWREQLVLSDALTYVENKDKIINFGRNFKKDGMRTFLSVEQGGGEMGDKILTLAEKLSEESVKILFEKYGEIIDEVDNIASYLNNSVEGKVLPQEVINSAKENLLVRGKDLLNNYAVKAGVCNGEECANIGKELEEKLSNIKASLLLFASACKSLSEEGLLSIEDLANTDLEIIHGGIDEKTQEEMKRIFKENRPNYSKELLDDVTKEFEDALKNSKENQTFYILRNNKDIASFMRLDEQEDGSIYGASFNVRTELRGSSIGTELMKKIVVKESSSRLFKILCYEKNPMLEKYKTEFGFNVVGEIDNYHNTGEKFYKMERSPSSNQ